MRGQLAGEGGVPPALIGRASPAHWEDLSSLSGLSDEWSFVFLVEWHELHMEQLTGLAASCSSQIRQGSGWGQKAGQWLGAGGCKPAWLQCQLLGFISLHASIFIAQLSPQKHQCRSCLAMADSGNWLGPHQQAKSSKQKSNHTNPMPMTLFKLWFSRYFPFVASLGTWWHFL